MGERKVLSKYYPADFNPDLIPRRKKRKRNDAKSVRMMLPMTIRCNSCGEFLYAGKKFLARKEDCPGENYLGIKRFRFFLKCSVCVSELVIKTDPEKSDYIAEKGCTRNFEYHKKKVPVAVEEKAVDAMKMLEKRAEDSIRQMDTADALDELQARNSRLKQLDTDELLQKFRENKQTVSSVKNHRKSLDEAEDEEAIKSITFRISGGTKMTCKISDDDIIGPTITKSVTEKNPGYSAFDSTRVEKSGTTEIKQPKFKIVKKLKIKHKENELNMSFTKVADKKKCKATKLGLTLYSSSSDSESE
eukprot:g5155.t1